MTVVVVVLSVWATRRATRPLARFADAAERLGLDVNAPPVDEDGPREVRHVAAAFNTMQNRIRTFVRDRTQMLAAISHDLRTPITRLRLRAEFIEDADLQKKMFDDLEQMEVMIASTLAFARDDAGDEAKKPFDLAVLLQGFCDDASDAGHAAVYIGPDRLTYSGRPIALGRVFTNLIDNAIHYGGNAQVNLAADDQQIVITVADDGDGIPEEQLEQVFAPFHRVEHSRSRETGGVGLGLSVVRSIVHAHGGEVTLSNRAEGGLLATVILPRD
ncbi:MAG: HAMP domain-containing protein [Alphaproteobacteria bacterium]|nr:HAMP domain-containing protein [Alphaproteobacteria bacterium]